MDGGKVVVRDDGLYRHGNGGLIVIPSWYGLKGCVVGTLERILGKWEKSC